MLALCSRVFASLFLWPMRHHVSNVARHSLQLSHDTRVYGVPELVNENETLPATI